MIRFGHDYDKTCMGQDEVLFSLAEDVKNFAVIYLVDITEVPDFNGQEITAQPHGGGIERTGERRESLGCGAELWMLTLRVSPVLCLFFQ